ncbi:MAG: DUF1016 N-terminal domain-containing protein [Paludibacteraceae bacterium]|nr:DUF1016 N-terminal domain-containing protein [Paludibacteraceae bacterium]
MNAEEINMMNAMAKYPQDINDKSIQLLLIIEQARSHVAVTANYELTMMYWHLGKRVNCDILDDERAAYGQKIVATVSRQLQDEYGNKGFDEKNLRRMMQFACLFPDEQISRHCQDNCGGLIS